ncbi:hypothetical protein R70006_04920 [Paraburkholderia domus]|uniref:hypothetical protein n=1 Tax=Paraburkholderia domus TaxID=2793075 RepID=UPI0019120BF9|nr:hypothetical protein [Paraburkholderia domus]MBK5051841.1 hypothetical protein [Burkholderia sp. R-70006]CAE6792675.1 hypothetical protein R70006_04920 [Paraburkholderia domus]
MATKRDATKSVRSGNDWCRGYYCAVSVLLREEGVVTPAVRSLFDQGGGAENADPDDIALFREHGLIA